MLQWATINMPVYIYSGQQHNTCHHSGRSEACESRLRLSRSGLFILSKVVTALSWREESSDSIYEICFYFLRSRRAPYCSHNLPPKKPRAQSVSSSHFIYFKEEINVTVNLRWEATKVQVDTRSFSLWSCENVTLNPTLGCLPVADKNHFKTWRERVNLAAWRFV